MKCKNCINSDVCNCFDDEVTETIAMNLDGEECKLFKDKSKFKEVVHGEWEKYKKHKPMCKEIYSIDFRCSVCHGFRFHNGEMRNHYKFCPNCGADMRGEHND